MMVAKDIEAIVKQCGFGSKQAFYKALSGRCLVALDNGSIVKDWCYHCQCIRFIAVEYRLRLFLRVPLQAYCFGSQQEPGPAAD